MPFSRQCNSACVGAPLEAMVTARWGGGQVPQVPGNLSSRSVGSTRSWRKCSSASTHVPPPAPTERPARHPPRADDLAPGWSRPGGGPKPGTSRLTRETRNGHRLHPQAAPLQDNQKGITRD